ncbi:MAG TPA: hypothetical protein PKA42_03645, partial [Candidatus Paceibacterota bacterium]|nr:hypothetical protein [Candidatus Paceibacterota bacterium]
AVRQSSLSNAEKNDIRDLVFLYTNGGGDVSVKIALEQKLKTHQITSLPPVMKEVEVKPEPSRPPLPFGSSRPAPVFTAPTISKAIPKPPTAEAKSNPVFVAPIKTSEVVRPVSPASAPAPVPSPAQSQPVRTEIPKPNPVPEIKSVPTPPASSTNVYLDRIREIKSAVNSKVGNPVNLVDIDNQVGREYMSALLEAMKRLSGGQPGGMEVAMSRLETAYSAVEKAVINYQQKTKPEPSSKPETITPPPVVPVVEEIPPTTPPPQPRPVPVAPRPTAPPPSAPVVPRPVPPPPQQAPAAVESVVPTPTNLASSPWSTPADFAAPAVSVKNEPAASELVPRPAQPIPSAPAQTPASPLTPAYKATSVLEEKKSLTPMDLPAMSSAASRAQTGDPLFTPEIESGLRQLLSDWSLFKKSGLFGTGPKGIDHPLYKQIADLQIPLLLTGRFEGSTQEIKQSITDYMNGWRYEQGIIYEKGETFERYLRRVIKQILDLQKKRLSS